jgi:hypothetical protein
MKRALYSSLRIVAGALVFFLLAATVGIDRGEKAADTESVAGVHPQGVTAKSR